jgi:hypothetical protein
VAKTNAERQQERHEQGLCGACGKKVEKAGEWRCNECKARDKATAAARYQRRKALGVCPQCKRRVALPGKSCCQECLDYHAAKTEANREAYAPRQRELATAWYEKRKAEGICFQCNGKNGPVRPGRTTCAVCGPRKGDASKKSFSEARRAALSHYGLQCCWCGQEEFRFLQLHHEDGDGAAHRLEIGQGRIYRWAIENGFPAGLFTLCANCNFEDGLKIRNRLGPVDELPASDILCIGCGSKTGKMAREMRFTCHECAVKKQQRDVARLLVLRDKVLNHYGRECRCCGSARALQMDHIPGGGRVHLREIGGSQLYPYLIKNNFPKGYQVLCANCNFAKRDKGACPLAGKPHRCDPPEPLT